MRGRNLAEGVPRSFVLNSNEILDALQEALSGIVSAVKAALEQTPPELGADVAERGMVLTGGGALLNNLDRLLMEETGIPVIIADDPLTCVARGGGRALENGRRERHRHLYDRVTGRTRAGARTDGTERGHRVDNAIVRTQIVCADPSRGRGRRVHRVDERRSSRESPGGDAQPALDDALSAAARDPPSDPFRGVALRAVLDAPHHSRRERQAAGGAASSAHPDREARHAGSREPAASQSARQLRADCRTGARGGADIGGHGSRQPPDHSQTEAPGTVSRRDRR